MTQTLQKVNNNSSGNAFRHEIHRVCNHCQTIKPGAIARCGTKMLGIKYPDDAIVTCAVCRENPPCPVCGKAGK